MKKKLLNTNKLKHGSQSAIFTLLFILAIIAVNVLATKIAERFPSINIDLTSSQVNTLSDDSENVAKSVEMETVIYIIGDEEAIRNDEVYSDYELEYSQVANLAEKLQEVNSLISVEFIDPDLNPAFISSYDGETITTGNVVVQTENRYNILTVYDLFSTIQDSDTGEITQYSKVDGALANAIYVTNLEEVPLIAVATGFGELLDSDYRATLDSLLEANYFEVLEFNISSEEIPEEATMVIIPTITVDYTSTELDKLRTYLATEDGDGSNSIMVLSEPNQGTLPNFEEFLEEWGIAYGDGILVETDTNNMLSGSGGLAYDYFFVENVFTGLSTDYEPMRTYSSRPIELLFTSSDGIITQAIFQTYDTAYTTTSGTTEENPVTDTYTTSAMASYYYTVDGTQYANNVIVYGDTIMFMSGYVNNYTAGNGEFLVDLIQYVTETDESDLGISIASVTTSYMDITASVGVIVFVGFFFFTIALPVAILIVGLVVFLKRRHL